MRHIYLRYIANKALSLIAFLGVFHAKTLCANEYQKTLALDFWSYTALFSTINILLGIMAGWFLMDDLQLKVGRKHSITTTGILLLLSLYPFFYYMPIMGDRLPYAVLPAVQYAQLLLGSYVFLFFKKILSK